MTYCSNGEFSSGKKILIPCLSLLQHIRKKQCCTDQMSCKKIADRHVAEKQTCRDFKTVCSALCCSATLISTTCHIQRTQYESEFLHSYKQSVSSLGNVSLKLRMLHPLLLNRIIKKWIVFYRKLQHLLRKLPWFSRDVLSSDTLQHWHLVLQSRVNIYCFNFYAKTIPVPCFA